MQLSSRHGRKVPAIVLSLGVASLGLLVAPASATGSPSERPDAPPTASHDGRTSTAERPESPAAYAAATFEAWLANDTTELLEYTTSPVGQFLDARRSSDPVGWHDPVCEGTAGSTYCTWARPGAQMAIRVANEPASQGEPHATTLAALETTGHNVAYWPFTTAEQASNTQEQVDQGSSPWLLDPVAVSKFFVQAELGWTDVHVNEVDTSTHRITDQESGTSVEVALDQPARQGYGGIWAVTAILSTTSEPSAPLLGYDGYKTLAIGQPDGEARATGLLVDRQPGDCVRHYLHPDEGRQNVGSGVFVDESEGVVWIGGTDKSHTPEGVAMGSTFEAVKAAYPDLTQVPPTDFVYTTPVPGHPDRLFRFSFDEADRVSDFGVQAENMGACNR